MKTITVFFSCLVSIILVAFLFLAPFLLPDTLYAQSQTQWSSLPSIDSLTTPAVTGHEDGRVYVVGIAFNGLVAHTSSSTPGGWGEWQIIGPQPTGGPFSFAFYAQPDTAPYIVRSGSTLYLFVRGKDNNLYESHKQGSNAWSGWQQLTSDKPVNGRISVAHIPQDQSFHVMFTGINQTVEYRCYIADSPAWRQRGTTTQWFNAVEGAAGTDGLDRVVAVIRQNDRQLLAQYKSSSWDSWTSLGIKSAGSGNFYDMSDVVFTAGYFHVAFAISYLIDDISMHYAYEIQHWRIRPDQNDPQSIRAVASYNPVVADPDGYLVDITHPRISLIVYRNKLVIAYRDPMKLVRYARWDNADPAAPWIAGKAIPDATKRTDLRPALGTLDRRPLLSDSDYAANHYGNDLFAAISETGTDALLFINFSRAIFSKEIDTQLSVYDSNSDGQQTVCRNQNEPLAPTLIADIGKDGRPFFTELGYILWTIPNWLIGSNFKRAGTLGCQAGNTSGRFDPNPTCDDTKYPVIIITQGGAGICNGVWVYRGDAYNDNLFHELHHSLSGGTLGFSDNNNEPPNATHEARSGIPLSALTSGFTLFGTRVNSDCFGGSGSKTCPNGRAPGFTGEASNYDATTRQHSFIGAIGHYFSDGGQMRTWIQQDLQQNDTLLQSKYNWIRDYVFRGIEFKKDNEIRVDEPLLLQILPGIWSILGVGGGGEGIRSR